MFETSEIKSYKRRVFLSSGMFLLSISLFILFLPTIIFVLFGGYDSIFPKQIYSIQSPDNKYSLNISRRVGLPVFSPIDPSGVINVSLKDTSNNNEINSYTFKIHEYGELTEPTVDWKRDEVQIENIDYHNEFSFKFPLPNS
jgi:hypothetical protein